ncbi:MAG: ABC transporter ATP-binding protein [Promethearchaeota archaeon]
MSKAIEVRDLCKNFGSFVALDRVNFEVEAGEVFGYLGPNGAGKTTTVRILTAISRPTSGKVLIAGYDIEHEEYAAKQQISLVPEQPIIYPELTAIDNLLFTASLYRIPRKERKSSAEALLETFGLYERRNQQAIFFSKGMKRRLSIAMGLISQPQTLFLDEPTSGLDVASQRLITAKIKELKEKGISIFLTTHNMQEAAQVCDRVAILSKGKVLAIDTPQRLKQAITETRSFEFETVEDPSAILEAYFTEINHRLEYTSLNKHKLRVYTSDPAEWGQKFIAWTRAKSVQIKSFATSEAKLEDVFVSLTGVGKLGIQPKEQDQKTKGTSRR